MNSKTSRRGGTPPWMLYAFDEMAKAEDPQSQTLDEYRKRLKRHAEDFRSLDEEQQEEYKQKASKGKDARQASKGLASLPFEASKVPKTKQSVSWMIRTFGRRAICLSLASGIFKV